MAAIFALAFFGLLFIGILSAQSKPVVTTCKPVPHIVSYDIECEAGEFPLPTHLIQPSVDVMKKCGYKVADAKRAINAVIVERPTIDSVGDVVRAAVLMLQVGGI